MGLIGPAKRHQAGRIAGVSFDRIVGQDAVLQARELVTECDILGNEVGAIPDDGQ